MSEPIKTVRTVEGRVTSTKMTNTVVVLVESQRRHKRYEKIERRRTKFYAHNELPVQEGDIVRIVHTRPISKLKCWKTVEVISKRPE